jgi:hypothetical protein
MFTIKVIEQRTTNYSANTKSELIMNQPWHILKYHPNTYQEELKKTPKWINNNTSHLVYGGVMLLNYKIKRTGKAMCRP